MHVLLALSLLAIPGLMGLCLLMEWLEQTFAATLQISPSMWSQIKSSRPIGDKLARQIEQHHGKPAGWLDEVRESDSVAPAEQAFLDLALKAWRATNSAGRKALREHLKLVAARISE